MNGFGSELNVAFGTVTEGGGSVPMVAIIIVGIICLIVGFILGIKLSGKLGFGGNGQPKMTSQDVFRQAQGLPPVNNQQIPNMQQRRPVQNGNMQQRRPQQMSNNGMQQRRPQQQMPNNGMQQRRPQQNNMNNGYPQQRPMQQMPNYNQRPMPQQPQMNDWEDQMSGRGWDD